MKQPEHKSIEEIREEISDIVLEAVKPYLNDNNEGITQKQAVERIMEITKPYLNTNKETKSIEGLRKEFKDRFDNEERILCYTDVDDPTEVSCGEEVWNLFLPHLNSRTEEDDFDYVAYEKEKKEVAEAIKNKDVIYISCRDGHALTEEQYYNFRDWVDTVGKPEGSSMESFVKVDLSADSLKRFVDFVQRDIGYADLRGLSLMAYLDKFLESEGERLQSVSPMTNASRDLLERFAEFVKKGEFIIGRGSGTLHTKEGVTVDTITLTNFNIMPKIDEFLESELKHE